MRRIGSIFLVISTVLLACSTVWGTNTAFTFDLPVMPLQYTVGAGPGGKVGTLTISHGQASYLIGQQLDLGSDGLVGGGGGAADSVVDWAKFSGSTGFDSSIQGDVYKLGTNNYQIKGNLLISDASSNLSTATVQASFVTNLVSLSSGFFSFDADIAALGANDAILMPSSGGSWVYSGIAGDTPVSPDLDSVRGQMSLASGRTFFNQGTTSGGYYTYSPTMNLDTFFGSDRSSVSFDVKTVVTPEPTSVAGLVVLAGLALGTRRSRR